MINEGQPNSSTKLAWLLDFNISVPISMQLADQPERQVKQEHVNVIC